MIEAAAMNTVIPMTDIATAILTYQVEQYRRDFTGFSHVSPVPHMGGKGKVNAELAALIPSLHRHTFVDLFGGGASVPLTVAARREGGSFRHRDVYEPLITFWTVLRDQPEELIAAIRALIEPYWGNHGPAGQASIRVMYANALAVLKANQPIIHDQVALAAAYYLHVHLCEPGTQFEARATSLNWGKVKNLSSALSRRLGELPHWSALIREWGFAKQDFRDSVAEAIQLGKRAFVFSDSPYEEKDWCYDCHFPAAYHDELAGMLRQVVAAGGRVMITTNWSETNIRRYADFTQMVRTQDYASKGKGRGTESGVELVILSYAPPHLDGLRRQFGWMTVEEGRAWVAARESHKQAA